MTIDYIRKHLNLLPHPEGGFYKEVYRSKETIPLSALPKGYSGDRNHSTSIYFLLTSDNFSAFHRIKQDEIWNFYTGDPLYVHVIDPEGNYTRHELGLDFENGAQPQFVVPGGCWFASSVKEGGQFSLVGCTVAPGFDFEDFELAEYQELADLYPKHDSVIKALTRS